MKKVLSLFIITILLIPAIVNAAECDPSKVYIDSIEKETNNNVIEIEESSANDKTINLNLEMFHIGDNIKYKLELKNDSEDDYIFDTDSLNINSKYIEYKIESKETSNLLKAKSSKTMYLIVNYKNQIPTSEFRNGTYEDNINMKVNLSYDDNIINPNTGINYILLIISILLISITIVVYKKKKYSTVLIIIGIVLLPLTVNALCRCMVNVNAKVKINNLDSSFCMYDFTDTDYSFANANKVLIPIKKDMTWNEFLTYATSGEDNRFKYEVKSICSTINCYEYGTEEFNEYINDSNYHKNYLLTYNNYIIEWYSKSLNDNPNDYYWEGIDCYFINDDFNNFIGYSVNSNLNDKIADSNSGVCYCYGCG